MYQRLQSDWNNYSGGRDEINAWKYICDRDPTVCKGDLAQYFVVDGQLNMLQPSGGPLAYNHGSILIHSIGVAGAFIARSFKDPQSMRGATIDEVRALAEASGLQKADLNPTAASGGEGERFSDPKNTEVQVMWERGEILTPRMGMYTKVPT
jgi:hypothetical protein